VRGREAQVWVRVAMMTMSGYTAWDRDALLRSPGRVTPPPPDGGAGALFEHLGDLGCGTDGVGDLWPDAPVGERGELGKGPRR